jgi:hypothetical protein
MIRQPKGHHSRRGTANNTSEQANIAQINLDISIEIRIADIAVAIAIGVQLAIATGIGIEWSIGYEDAVIFVIWNTIMIEIRWQRSCGLDLNVDRITPASHRT